MDRSLKNPDKVLVFQSDYSDKPLETFYQVPYSYGGFDYYTYRNKTYPGFVKGDHPDQKVYILLSYPLVFA